MNYVNYVHGWFEVWGWLFWTFFFVEFCLVCGAVRARHLGKATFSVLGFILFCYVFGDASMPTWAATRAFFYNHRWFIGLVAAIEVCGALIWPFKQWKLLFKEHKKKIQAIRRAWLRAQGLADHAIPDEDAPLPEKYRQAWTHYVFGDPDAPSGQEIKSVSADWTGQYTHTFSAQKGDVSAAEFARPIRARDHINDIVAWSAWWFAYAFIYIFEHFIQDLFEGIVLKFRTIFDALMTRWYRDIERDFIKPAPKPAPAEELDDAAV